MLKGPVTNGIAVTAAGAEAGCRAIKNRDADAAVVS
jgi:hypothetical protein